MPELQVFSHPFMYWVGMDTDPRTTPDALAEFNRFYSTTHVHEVLAAHPGFVSVSRYELLEPDPRGGEHRGPRWLAVYEAQDQAAAEQYVKDNVRPWLHRRKYSPWPPARRKAKTVWRMLWRRIAASAAIDTAPETVCIVGANAPETDARDGEWVERFELYRAFAHPEPGCPRYLTISTLGDGEDESVWRLVYRRIPPPE